MASGIVRVETKKGQWIQLPDVRCNSVTFEAADYDLTESPSGEPFFHVARSDGVFTIPLATGAGVSNLNSYWARSDSPIILIWSS
jgi:hypothetical protein